MMRMEGTAAEATVPAESGRAGGLPFAPPQAARSETIRTGLVYVPCICGPTGSSEVECFAVKG
jgi:hypothetical protein